ncbi:LOW QUALITY PROTEIN: igE-binding protein-like [Meriones unguiculatus]|uniref:LOW QUALITY PROTEIN: igE-binding protein-like n=1 Tax=Meriones unguiculatus TaxID=10047 RepID=UPI00293F39DF|nr:LOW QUALITY PROTEIN: igE-binding protein-like [Meriones unguiculatus]
MGNQPTKPILEAAQALLKQKDLKIPDRVLRNFLKEVDRFKNYTISSSSEEETSSEGEDQQESSDSEEEAGLDPAEQAELDEEAAKYERGRYGRAPPYMPGYGPTAPPYEAIEKNKAGGGSSLIPGKEMKKIQAAFPVWEDAQNQRHHTPLDLKQLKALVESVQTYGVSASFTLALIERLAANAMTPDDWANTVKACLSMGQYLDWRSIYQELCMAQAKQNIANQRPQWSFDMLTGQGQWVVNQTMYPVEVYEQINKAAVRAWKSLPNKGQVTGNLTKIIQGATEPFSDFVARMMEAAGRIFEDPEGAMPFVEQLIYEQCTKECRNAITPWKGKGINVLPQGMANTWGKPRQLKTDNGRAWGMPKTLKTDNGPAYTSQKFQQFCRQLNVTHLTGLPYNPQGQGIVERAHHTLKSYLIKQKRGIEDVLPSVPRVAVSMALFTLNFLNLDDKGHTAAERHTQSLIGQKRWLNGKMF